MIEDQDLQDPALESLLGEVADEYTRQIESGQQPDIEEYARRHPGLSAVIRQVFPAIAAMHGRATEEPVIWESRTGGNAVQPDHLGDYRIIREIGRGGMGVVYEAEQQSLQRRVALKVLPFAAVLDSRQLQRFKNEAQAAANLHHTHIVPVFSLGSERGVYYYAMQFIDGQPLSSVIRVLQEISGKPTMDAPRLTDTAGPPHSSEIAGLGGPGFACDASSQLTCSLTGRTASREKEVTSPPGGNRQFFQLAARLAVQAAEALQYAHEQGVIHRDVKPSNLLVTADGHLWVADFGLALMQTHPNLTMPGDLLGTIRYMSPEQALSNRGTIDHRTDIYSLGVTLYELLALEPAFAGTDRHELLRRIAFEDPRLLRRCDSSIPRELETIVGKAMAKRPEDRYATAQEMADDLRRFLEDKPILAKPPTVRDRMAKWSRRHRSVVLSSAVFLVLAVIGLGASTILVLHQRNLLRQQYERADANLRIARGNVDRMLRWMEAQEFSQLPYLPHLRQDVLEESLAFHRKLLPEKTHDPVARLEAGEIYLQLARIKTLLGQDEEAEGAYREGIAVLESLAGEFPTVVEYADKLANGCFDRAAALWESKRFAEAEAPARQSLGLFQKLTAECPTTPHFRQELGRCWNLLGVILRDQGDARSGEAALREALVMQKDLAALFPQEPQHQVELARTYRNLAGMQFDLNRREEASGNAQRALALQADLTAAYPDDDQYRAELSRTRRWWDEIGGLTSANPSPEKTRNGEPTAEISVGADVLANGWSGLADALRRSVHRQDATAVYCKAVTAQKKLIAKYPDAVEYRKRLVEIHRRQARSMLTEWQLDGAERALQAALEVAAELAIEDPQSSEYRDQMRSLLDSLQSVRAEAPLADLVVPSKKSAEGVGLAVQRARQLDPESIQDEPMPLLIYADYLILGDQAGRAIPVIRKAIEAGGNTPCFNKSLGLALLHCGRIEEARAAFARAVASDSSVPEAGPFKSSNADTWTAAYFLDRITVDEFTQRWLDRAICLGNLGCLPWFYIGFRLEIEGKPDEARSAYLKALEAGRVPNPHLTANWAAYRLNLLGATGPSASAPAHSQDSLR